MVNIAVTEVQVSGDIGGVGVSRYHWQTPGGTTPVPADCDNALTAVHAFYTACASFMPVGILWQVQPDTLVVDAVSAVPIAVVASTVSLAAVVGTDSDFYAAGTGARINWKSSTVFGRRFMRGCNFMVPLSRVAFNNSGAINTTCATAIVSAAQVMANAFQTAGLELVIYGRPKKGLITGGHVGTITAMDVPQTPAGLRSRRS